MGMEDIGRYWDWGSGVAAMGFGRAVSMFGIWNTVLWSGYCSGFSRVRAGFSRWLLQFFSLPLSM